MERGQPRGRDNVRLQLAIGGGADEYPRLYFEVDARRVNRRAYGQPRQSLAEISQLRFFRRRNRAFGRRGESVFDPHVSIPRPP